MQVIYDRETRQPRGFGFVTFTNVRDVGIAIREMDGQVSQVSCTRCFLTDFFNLLAINVIMNEPGCTSADSNVVSCAAS